MSAIDERLFLVCKAFSLTLIIIARIVINIRYQDRSSFRMTNGGFLYEISYSTKYEHTSFYSN